MRAINRRDVERYVVGLAEQFSALQRVTLDMRVYRDLGIGRGDAVEFYRNIENEFRMDLRNITEEIVEVPATFFRRVRHATIPKDPSLSEIIAVIMTTD